MYPVLIELDGPTVWLSDPAFPEEPKASIVNAAYEQLHESLKAVQAQSWKGDLLRHEVIHGNPR